MRILKIFFKAYKSFKNRNQGDSYINHLKIEIKVIRWRINPFTKYII